LSSAKKRVIVSACLLGELCRYDGKTKQINAVIKAFEGWEIIPFCPEAPLFGTPRERISVVRVSGENRIIKDESREDVTALLELEIEQFCAQYPEIDAIVLKSKSPSCGFNTTPILGSDGKVLDMGNGIAAELFLEKYRGVLIESEHSFL